MRRIAILLALGAAPLVACCTPGTPYVRETPIEYRYDGPHPIPYGEGGGWCYEAGFHDHAYAIDQPTYYSYSENTYRYVGPIACGFEGPHPTPGGGWCYLDAPHSHDYCPPAEYHTYYRWEPGHRVYVYLTPPPPDYQGTWPVYAPPPPDYHGASPTVAPGPTYSAPHGASGPSYSAPGSSSGGPVYSSPGSTSSGGATRGPSYAAPPSSGGNGWSAPAGSGPSYQTPSMSNDDGNHPGYRSPSHPSEIDRPGWGRPLSPAQPSGSEPQGPRGSQARPPVERPGPVEWSPPGQGSPLGQSRGPSNPRVPPNVNEPSQPPSWDRRPTAPPNNYAPPHTVNRPPPPSFGGMDRHPGAGYNGPAMGAPVPVQMANGRKKKQDEEKKLAPGKVRR